MGFIPFNVNPKNKMVGDCTIRAISLLTDQNWDETFIGLMVTAYQECDMPASNAVWSKYLYSLGYKRGVIQNTCPNCYTIREFCDQNNKGIYMLSTGEHVVTVIDGCYYDTWDSGDLVPAHYWFKGE